MPDPNAPPAPAGGRPNTPARDGRPRKEHLRLGSTAARIEARLDAPACAALERLRVVLTERTGRAPSLSKLICTALTATAPAAPASGEASR